MSIVLYFVFLCVARFSFQASSFGETEWLPTDFHTLNVSGDRGLAVDESSEGAPDLRFYPFTEFWVNASGSGFNPYSYLCFISSSQAQSSFILSICMTSQNRGNGFDFHTPVVWSANRQNPAKGQLINLTLQQDGDLVLIGDADTSPAWRTDTANKGVVKMQLEQNPINLVLYNAQGGVVWQSMDYPTDTLTHWQALRFGMKPLVSWASPTDLSEGSYSLHLLPASVALIYSSSTPIRYWTDEPYMPSNVSTVLTVSAIGFIATSEKSNNFLTNYDFVGEPVLPCAPGYQVSNKTFLRLESDGSLHLYVLDPQQWNDLCPSTPTPSPINCSFPLQCGPYGLCSTGGNCDGCPSNQYFAPFNLSVMARGCNLTQPLIGCNDSRLNSSLSIHEMFDMHGYDYFSNAYSTPISGISDENACKGTCLKNCSCVAAFWHVHTLDCFHVNIEIGSLRGSQNESLYRAYLKVRMSPPSSQDSRRFKLGFIIGSTVFVGFSTTFVFLYCKLCRNRSKNVNEEEDVMLDTLLGLPTRYTYTELEDITHNFSKMLGKGGFGAVYEGMLGDGSKVAVKKLESVRQGDKEFRAELAIMAGIHHYNLLRLLGFCAQGEQRLLVYEYMENGSLDQWLFNRSRAEDDLCTHREPLAWDVRFRVAVGIAKGLAYLHESCQERILHLDVKPQNILLDKDFVPKVADFGLSRLVGREEAKVMTTMRGTPGYLAPEWLRGSSIDEKCDIFSFGMLLLEIISGRKNFDPTQEDPDCRYYPEWAFRQAQGLEYQLATGSAEVGAKIFTDAALRKEEEGMQVRRMIKTAFLCVLEDPTLRPSMQQVVQMLEGLLDVMSLQISSLLQGLLFVLSNARAHGLMQEAVEGIVASSNVPHSAFSAATMSLEFSAR